MHAKQVSGFRGKARGEEALDNYEGFLAPFWSRCFLRPRTAGIGPFRALDGNTLGYPTVAQRSPGRRFSHSGAGLSSLVDLDLLVRGERNADAICFTDTAGDDRSF